VAKELFPFLVVVYVRIIPMKEQTWTDILKEEKEKEYFKKVLNFSNEERKTKKIFPPADKVFNAFKLTPFENIKVVILGQDPYHGQGQAEGLCFSVQPGVKLPPSLKNIYKEIESDLKIKMNFESGHLAKWAEQGVFLLNAVLTVEEGKPASHAGKGWEIFTDEVIRKISDNKDGVVFILWGNYAIKKKSLIDEKKHFVLTAPHPSPFSVHTGFFGCKHFSRTNEILKQENIEPIDWQIK
jgi:uracil-DNA glycosylase